MTYRQTIWGNYEVDPSTNLPVVPKNHFWRVTKKNTIDLHELHLRRKRWIGSVKVEYSFLNRNDNLFDKGAFVMYAARLKETKFTIGDYPPNKA